MLNTLYRTAPYKKELSIPKCQQGWGWAILVQVDEWEEWDLSMLFGLPAQSDLVWYSAILRIPERQQWVGLKRDLNSRTLPNMWTQLFAKMNPTTEACEGRSTFIMEWYSLPFWPSGGLPVPVPTGKFSFTSGVGTLSLSFSRAQLLPLALPLECLGENKAWILLHLTNTSCLAQRPLYLLPHWELCQRSESILKSVLIQCNHIFSAWQPSSYILWVESATHNFLCRKNKPLIKALLT